jgi:hypothetical protein
MNATLTERQLVAVLAATNASAIDSFIKAVDRVSSGEDPEEMAQAAMASIAIAAYSGRLSKAVECFGVSTQALDTDLLGGFLKLKEAVERLMSSAMPLGQA